MPLHNPYTKEPVHGRPEGRRWVDYAFLAVAAVGVLYIFAYVWPWWPWTARLNQSGQTVGFLYFFLGGWGWARAQRQREVANAGANRWIAALLLPIAAWDVASPFVLRDLHPLSVSAHVLFGLFAFGVSAYALRGARQEPSADATPAR